MDRKEELVPELEGVDLNTGAVDMEQTLDLDEIMREFSSAPQAPAVTEETPDEVLEPLAEASEETVTVEPVEEQPQVTGDTMAFEPVEEQPQVTGDTMAFEPVEAETPVTGDTVEFAPQEGDTAAFTPIGGSEETIEEMDRKDRERLEELQSQQEGSEPFSEQWEPEYEQPMGDYVPAPQILVHPRSRLKELKRKLIEGPEKRYYELTEQGLGKLYLAIALCLLAVLVSVGISIMSGAGQISDGRLKLLVFSQLFLMLFAALLGSFQLIEGVADLGRGRFSLNTLLVVTFGVCCVDAVLCLKSLRVPCCAAFSLQMLLSLWSEAHRRGAEMGMMDTMRKAVRLDKVAAEPDYYNGKPGVLRGEGQVEDFMDHYDQPSEPVRFQGFCALGALVLAVALGAVAFVMYGVESGMQVLTVSLLAGAPAAAFISVSRPLAILEKRLHKQGVVLCGWQGVKGLKQKLYFPVDHQDLFPVGTVKMNGVKFFGSRLPDEVVAYGTALVSADGGGLAPLFEQVLQSRNGKHYEVENFRTYEGGGIGGEVNGEPVLVGLLPFLRDMGVEIPEGLRVDQAVCVSIDGDLCGIFALTYDRSNAVTAALHTVASSSNAKLLLTNMDFMLNPSFLRAKFNIRGKKLTIPSHEESEQLRDKKLGEEAQALLLTTKNGIGAAAYGVTGAKALYTASWMGAILQIVGGFIGLAIIALMIWKNGITMLSPDNMFLFQLIWLVPAVLISEWTRSL